MVEKDFAMGIAFGIPGMQWPSETGWLYSAFSKSSNHIEIGSFCGKSAWIAAAGMQGKPSKRVFMVEDFRYPLVTGPWTERVLEATRIVIKNVAEVDTTLIKKSSMDAYKECRQKKIRFDSLFIDGSHDYDSVKQDIEMWSELVKTGGIISGHDYWPAHAGVMDAVNYTGPFNVVPETRIWYRTK